MSRGQAIVDIAADPLAALADRRRAVLRIGVPIAGVLLMIAVVLAIAVHVNRANRNRALELADDVVAATGALIVEEVTAYFAVPLRALEEGRSIGEAEQAGEARRELIQKFSIGAMKHVPQIADFIMGDSEGDFMMLRRGNGGGIDTKFIDNAPGGRKVLWIRRNTAGDVIGRDLDPTDNFDPRTRPWYLGALSSSGIFWTDVYVFFTANALGVTAASRYRSPEGRDFVVGVDITLANLSEFLANLQIGQSGRAMILGGQGQVIAYPQFDKIIRHDGSGAITANIRQIGDPVAAGAYDHFRVEGPGRDTITVDGGRYLASLTPLQTVGRNWSVMIVVPEGDFVAAIERNARTALLMSLAIVVLAAAGAALLVRQGLRVDRATRLMRDRNLAMARQSEALELVADEADAPDPSFRDQPQTLTEIAAEITGARHANLWYLASDGNVLRCTDSFDSETSRHSGGFELHRNEIPQLFDAFAAGKTIDVANAANDPLTADVYRLTMAPLGSRSLSLVPMRRQGNAIGAIALHDATDMAGSRHTLRILASMAAPRASDSAGSPRSALEEVVKPVSEPDAVRSSSTDLLLRPLDAERLGGALYPEVAVLVVRIDDPDAAANDAADIPKLLDSIVCFMQEIAAEQDIPYLKIVDYYIVGAAGFSPEDPTAMPRIANTAVASRDRLIALFQANGLEPHFRLGIDFGTAIGQPLGSNPRVFNLWGEAVRTAQIMSASALPGSIQTSEAAYLRLRQGFLLRPRGTFYRPRLGTSQTFVLAR